MPMKYMPWIGAPTEVKWLAVAKIEQSVFGEIEKRGTYGMPRVSKR